MKYLFAFLLALLSAISAEAQIAMLYGQEEEVDKKLMEKPRFFDNWSLSLVGGAYHPMYYDLKYLLDCSGYAGEFELRKQITPVFGFGLAADGYYRLQHKERQDPRTVVGPVVHLNLMNLFGGYLGKPRVFETEIDIMPAWGRLYRGTGYDFLPDENYFATKYGLNFCFNVGRRGAWSLNLKPAVVFDVTSKAPKPGNVTLDYEAFSLKRSDLQVFLGFTYRFRNHGGKRNFHFAPSRQDRLELERLNEIVNFLRNDVEQRDNEIQQLKEENEKLKQQQGQ